MLLKNKEITGYAIRALVYIADTGGVVPKREICEAMKRPTGYFDTMIRRAQRQGLVNSIMGAHGGYSLAKAPAEISLYDIYVAFEGKPDDGNCPVCKKPWSSPGDASCPIHSILQSVADQAAQQLRQTTLQQLIEKRQLCHV